MKTTIYERPETTPGMTTKTTSRIIASQWALDGHTVTPDPFTMATYSGNKPTHIIVDEAVTVTRSWHYADDRMDIKCSNNCIYNLTQHETDQLSAGKSIHRDGVTISAVPQPGGDGEAIIPVTVTPDVAPTWTPAEMSVMRQCSDPWNTVHMGVLRKLHGEAKYTAMMNVITSDDWEGYKAKMNRDEKQRNSRHSRFSEWYSKNDAAADVNSRRWELAAARIPTPQRPAMPPWTLACLVIVSFAAGTLAALWVRA